MRVGLISDTHGLVRAAVHRALSGTEMILHAGDVGGQDVLDELGSIAPVRAVSGNTDPPGMPGLERGFVVTLAGVTVRVTHGHEFGSPAPERLLEEYDEDVIVYGHTHRALIHRAGNRLVVNPGAAGAARFGARPTVAVLTVEGRNVSVELVELE